MYFVLYRMYFNKNTVSKHKNASIKIIKSFILPFVVCILHSKWTHANCSTAKQIISIFYAVKPDRYAVQLVSSRTSERETLVLFPALRFIYIYIYIKCARVMWGQMYLVTRYTNGSAPSGVTHLPGRAHLRSGALPLVYIGSRWNGSAPVRNCGPA